MPILPLLVFDVNETLLDLRTMEPTFERIFGEKIAMRLWFANLIMYSQALTLADSYVPFTDIGSAVMKMLGDTSGIRISENDKKELNEKFSAMPPYPDVGVALPKLRAAGFRLFTLTNNLLEVTLAVDPHLRPSGSRPQLTPARYGFGRSFRAPSSDADGS
jgi:2-haloacid dehalogenase